MPCPQQISPRGALIELRVLRFKATKRGRGSSGHLAAAADCACTTKGAREMVGTFSEPNSGLKPLLLLSIAV